MFAAEKHFDHSNVGGEQRELICRAVRQFESDENSHARFAVLSYPCAKYDRFVNSGKLSTLMCKAFEAYVLKECVCVLAMFHS